MVKLYNKIRQRFSSDSGASTTIEFLFVILALIIFTMSILDLTFYFSNRNIVTQSAQSGARLVSIYGGGNETPIASKYGGLNGATSGKDYHSIGNGPAAYGVLDALEAQSSSSVNLNIKSVNCFVIDAEDQNKHKTTVETLQDRPACTVEWTYKGIPGSLMSFFSDLTVAHKGVYTTTETANAEVIMKGNN